jgi:hypothetical protein
MLRQVAGTVACATLVVLGAGCSVPDVSFYDDAAAAEAGVDATVDGGLDGTGDDATTDATDGSPDASGDQGPDAPGEASSGCPGKTPPGWTTCCGPTPCVDRSGGGCNCPQCQAQGCAAAAFCCFDSNDALSCKNALASCK